MSALKVFKLKTESFNVKMLINTAKELPKKFGRILLAFISMISEIFGVLFASRLFSKNMKVK